MPAERIILASGDISNKSFLIIKKLIIKNILA